MHDLLVVLGSQIGINEQGQMVPAPHTEMKIRAAGIAYQQGICERFVLCGGHCVNVRYDLRLSVPVFGTPKSDRKADFSELAKQKARIYRSEASVMAEILRKEFEVPASALILEEDSMTTAQNATYFDTIFNELHRRPMGPNPERIGVVTLLYHMQRALADFNKERYFPFKPVFAELLLALGGGIDAIEKICEYYSTPKGGKQYNVDRIRQLLTEGKSLAELM